MENYCAITGNTALGNVMD